MQLSLQLTSYFNNVQMYELFHKPQHESMKKTKKSGVGI